MKLSDKLQKLKSERKAILAANFYNFETLSGILKASSELKMPVILQLSESSIRYMGLKVAASLAKAAINEFGAESWLHLDHGSSIDIIRRCLDAGFDSVMIDASEKPFGENISVTKQAVAAAASYGANVEAELGFVAKLGQEQGNLFTSPSEAREFVERTGVNALAVAIGSAHGFYKKAPKLEIELLATISKTVPVPLVLHGSSGIPDDMLIDAVRNGICKINLATETKNAFMLALKDKMKQSSEIDLRIVFPDAISAVTELIGQKLRTIDKA